MIAILLKTNDLLYLQVQYNKRLLVTRILKKKKNLLKSKNREEWRKKQWKREHRQKIAAKNKELKKTKKAQKDKVGRERALGEAPRTKSKFCENKRTKKIIQ